jgi:hypothetical protein
LIKTSKYNEIYLSFNEKNEICLAFNDKNKIKNSQ